MANSFKITKRDDRTEKILREPDKYYSEARQRARKQVERDLARSTDREHSRSASGDRS